MVVVPVVVVVVVVVVVLVVFVVGVVVVAVAVIVAVFDPKITESRMCVYAKEKETNGGGEKSGGRGRETGKKTAVAATI